MMKIDAPIKPCHFKEKEKRKKEKKRQLFCAESFFFFSVLFWNNDYLQVWPTSHQGISGFLQVQVDHWYY